HRNRPVWYPHPPRSDADGLRFMVESMTAVDQSAGAAACGAGSALAAGAAAVIRALAVRPASRVSARRMVRSSYAETDVRFMADWEYAKDCRIGQDQLSDEFCRGLRVQDQLPLDSLIVQNGHLLPGFGHWCRPCGYKRLHCSR